MQRTAPPRKDLATAVCSSELTLVNARVQIPSEILGKCLFKKCSVYLGIAYIEGGGAVPKSAKEGMRFMVQDLLHTTKNLEKLTYM